MLHVYNIGIIVNTNVGGFFPLSFKDVKMLKGDHLARAIGNYPVINVI